MRMSRFSRLLAALVAALLLNACSGREATKAASTTTSRRASDRGSPLFQRTTASGGKIKTNLLAIGCLEQLFVTLESGSDSMGIGSLKPINLSETRPDLEV